MQRSITSHMDGNHSRFRPTALLDYVIEGIAPCPWVTISGSQSHQTPVANSASPSRPKRPLYTPQERVKRDQTRWTLVQGVLAPIQFAVFVVSLGLVLNYLWTGAGYEVATASIILKTALLYTIMVTGAIWEKVVFGHYLFADSFYWEDVFSMAVLALHTLYLAGLWFGFMSADELMLCALAAYAAYAINATQFVLKLRTARKERPVAGFGEGQTA